MSKRPSLDSVRPKSSEVFNSGSLSEQGQSVLKSIAESHYGIISWLNRNILLTTIFYILSIGLISYSVDTYGEVPKSYFSNKYNVFNQYFVKLGWGWTLWLLLAFVGLTSYIRSGGSFGSVFRNCLRMLGGTACWYISVSIFDYVHKTSGFCGHSFAWDLSTCKPQDVKRIDISGHTFLLLFCILVILEELRLFDDWSLSTKKCAFRNFKSIEKARKLHFRFSVVVYLLVVLIIALFALWNVMLISTILYFHDMLQKVLGALFANVSWIILYRFIYKFLSISPLVDN